MALPESLKQGGTQGPDTTYGTKTDAQANIAGSIAQKSVTSGQYDIPVCKLLVPGPGGAMIEQPLGDAFVSLNLSESINENTVSGSITLIDNSGKMEFWPIVGEEKLELQAMTKGIVVTQSNATRKSDYIENTFRVTSITDIQRIKERAIQFTLNFVTEEAILNLKKRVQKSYNSTIWSIVQDIFLDYLVEDIAVTGDRFSSYHIEDTVGTHNIAIPNMTPFQALNFLASRAVSYDYPNSSSYFFYETFTDGFYFESLDKLMAQPVKATYVYAPQNVGESPGLNVYIAENPEIISAFDIISNADSGMYSSRLIAHDMVRMKYSILDYNYIPQPQTTTTPSANPSGPSITTPNIGRDADKNWPKHQSRTVINDMFSHLENTNSTTGPTVGKRLISDKMDLAKTPENKFNPLSVKLFPTNFQHDILFNATADSTTDPTTITDVSPISSGQSFNETAIKTNHVERWMLQRDAQLQQMSNIKIRFSVAGDTSKHIGDLVEFKYPSFRSAGPGKPLEHQLYSGKYLITAVEHAFSQSGFKTQLTLSKDSLATQLQGQSGIPNLAGRAVVQGVNPETGYDPEEE